MSYTRRYRSTISHTITVNYPKSESGGSVSKTVDIPVDVNIHVNTSPFDNSVRRCSGSVNKLTGAVVATQTAQVATIHNNSKKIANSIVSGFFGYIRYEISHQIAELKQKVDAQLMHLKELATSCLKKKDQMAGDYYRISERYLKIFRDLDNELTHRIGELDKPTFLFRKETDGQQNRFSGTDLVNTVTVFGTECSNLQSQISVSVTKKRALDALNQAKTFLWQQKYTNATIQQSMINENVSGPKVLPVCFMETTNDNNRIDRNLFFPEYMDAFKNNRNRLTKYFLQPSVAWKPVSSAGLKNLESCFNSELNNAYSTADPRAARVKETIQRIADLSSINTISN